jgi:hypothetical protein
VPAGSGITAWLLPEPPLPAVGGALAVVQSLLDLRFASQPEEMLRALALVARHRGAAGGAVVTWQARGEPEIAALWGADLPECGPIAWRHTAAAARGGAARRCDITCRREWRRVSPS